MTLMLCAYALASLLAPILVRYLGRRAFLLLATLPVASVVWTILQAPIVLHGDGVVEKYSWVPALSLSLDLRLDALAWLMSLVVGVVGAIILVYCSAYFATKATALGRFAGCFMAFAGAMTGLVLADNTLVIYLFWELTTVFSYLLIGHYHEKQGSRRAAAQAITVTTAGGLAMLAGFIVLGLAPGGSFSVHELVAAGIDGTLGAGAHPATMPVAAMLLLAGALTKSAQLPFHFWLPAAMAAPTPVSGYLHAAAMVKAGVYLVARFSPALAAQTPWPVVVTVAGGLTMLLGGYLALRQYDLKLLLAYGTVSQLGFILTLVGSGDAAITLAGLAVMTAHACFKSALFLAVGTIDHELGTRDLRKISGVGKAHPVLAIFSCLAAASMAGLPPTLGYVGKEAAFHTAEGRPPVFVVILLGSILTMAYTLRFCWGAFVSRPAAPTCEKKPIGKRLVGSTVVLASLGLAFGLIPHQMTEVFSHHAAQLAGKPGHLALWGGIGPALFATIAVIVFGGFMFWKRRAIARFQLALNRRAAIISAEEAYSALIRGMYSTAGRITSLVQTGSVAHYLQIMLVTMLGAGAITIAVLRPKLVAPRAWDSPLQAGLVVVAGIAAVLVVKSRRRLKAVLVLALVGYITALLFAIQGAPDLALTQAVVETVTLVTFVLVMRRLPPYFSNRPLRSSRVVHVIIGVLVGVGVAMFGWYAVSARIHDPVTVDYPAEVVAFGYGKNIVNVTLVDTRAWDTIGEISVVLAAATGVASLVFIRTRSLLSDMHSGLASAIDRRGVWNSSASSRRHAESLVARGRLRTEHDQLRPGGRGRVLLPGAGTLAMVRRSLILEIGARVIFHPLLMFSLFLLFSGHNNPGGGFAGGMIAGLALITRYLAGGRFELALAMRVRPSILLGIGMLIATTAALIPIPLGGTILQTTVFDLQLPIFEHVHLATALFFDIGVYLIVVGMVMDILLSLGAEVDRQAEMNGTAAWEVSDTTSSMPAVVDAREPEVNR